MYTTDTTTLNLFLISLSASSQPTRVDTTCFSRREASHFILPSLFISHLSFISRHSSSPVLDELFVIMFLLMTMIYLHFVYTLLLISLPADLSNKTPSPSPSSFIFHINAPFNFSPHQCPRQSFVHSYLVDVQGISRQNRLSPSVFIVHHFGSLCSC